MVLKEKKDLPLQVLLVVADVILIVISFMAAYFLRYRVPGIHGPGFFIYQKSILIVIPLWIGVSAYFGLYRVRRAWRLSEVIFNSVLAVSVGMVLYLTVSYLVKEFFFSRLLLFFLWGVNIVVTSGFRVVFKSLLVRVRRTGVGIRRILIVGNSPSSRMLSKVINLHPELGYRIIAYLTPEGAGEANGNHGSGDHTIAGEIHEILGNIDELCPDEAIFSIPIGKREEIWGLINSLQKQGVTVRIVPDIYEFFSARMAMEDLEGIPMIKFRPITYQSWERGFKLGLDYLGAIFLLILSSPIVIFVSLKLKAFFKEQGILVAEKVIGQFGHPIDIYRFRIPMKTICSNPSEKSIPTPFGEMLYKYSLTEIPQFYNVLKGELSLVGPRPETPTRVERYSEFHRRRLLIKPGITGLAQVNGLRGFDSSDEKTHFDLKYIEEYSVLLDIRILLQTIWVILKRHKQPTPLFSST